MLISHTEHYDTQLDLLWSEWSVGIIVNMEDVRLHRKTRENVERLPELLQAKLGHAVAVTLVVGSGEITDLHIKMKQDAARRKHERMKKRLTSAMLA